MSDIVKVINKECFIDSEGLAVLSENEHRAVLQLIRNHKQSLGKFGAIAFEMSKPTAKGGRPKQTYLLNEQQATLLTTFMKNSKKVTEFKIKLVTEFFKMREALQKTETIRLAGIQVRKSLTDSVKESGENERMHGHGYSQYTKMVYEICDLTKSYKVWSDIAKLDPEYKKIGFRDYISQDSLKRVELAESLIKPLLELDKQYADIKETLKPLFEKKELI